MKGKTRVEGVWKQGAEEDFWAQEGWSKSTRGKNCIVKNCMTCTVQW